MTLHPPSDSRLMCRIQLTGPDRWVSLALSLGELGPGARLLAMSERLVFEMAGVDEAAQKYGLSNWQGGILSGARYAFRALKAPVQQVRIHELRGQLGGGDVWAIASAAAVAVARLLEHPPEFPVDLAGWKIEEEVWRPRSPAAEAPGNGAEAISSPPESQSHSAKDPVTGSADATVKVQDVPTDANPAADRPGD